MERTRQMLADLLIDLQQYENALEMFSTNLYMRNMSGGRSTKDEWLWQVSSCFLLPLSWRPRRCVRFVQRSRQVAKSGLRQQLMTTISTLVEYVDISHASEKWAEAEKLYQKILGLRIKSFGLQHEETITAPVMACPKSYKGKIACIRGRGVKANPDMEATTL